MIKETGCEPEIDSWQEFLPTIPTKADRIDANTVARYLCQENG